MRKCKFCQTLKEIDDFYKPTIYVCKKCQCMINSGKVVDRNKIKYPDLPDEAWCDVVGYEELYSVSNKGRIKSKIQRGYILNPQIHKQGYLRVGLTKNNKRKSVLIHRLVADAFVQNPQNKKTINHIDGNKSNNNADNLEWCTQKENNIHAWNTGLAKTTKNHIIASCKNAKIAKNDVLSIMADFSEGFSLTELSEKYNISKAQVSRIVNGKSRKSTLKYL